MDSFERLIFEPKYLKKYPIAEEIRSKYLDDPEYEDIYCLLIQGMSIYKGETDVILATAEFCYSYFNKPAVSLKLAKAVIKISPKCFEAHFLASKLFFRLRNFSRSRKHAIQAYKVNSNDTKLLAHLLTLDKLRKNSKLVVKWLSLLISIEKEKFLISVNLSERAKEYLQLGRYDECQSDISLSKILHRKLIAPYLLDCYLSIELKDHVRINKTKLILKRRWAKYKSAWVNQSYESEVQSVVCCLPN